jgi:hypothetical protein
VQPIIEIVTDESLHRSNPTAQTLSQLVVEKGSAPFDLSKGPFIRFTLVEISPTHHQLLMTTHHLVADGWSIELIWSELSQVYSALVSGELPALATPTSIEAFNNWQKAAFTSEEESARQAYWQREFARNYPSLQLPADRLHPVAAGKVGQSFSMPIPDALKQQLVQLAQQEKTTLFNVLLAGYTVLLYRLSNQETFVLGIPASGQVQMGESCLVGQCVRMLPFYSRIEPERSVSDYLLHIRTQMAEIIRHQTCSFDRILQTESQLAPPRIATEIDMNSVKNQFRFKGLTNRISFPTVAYVKYDLSVSLIEMNAQLSADFYFNTALFEKATVENWAQRYFCLLQDMAEKPLKSLLDLQLSKEEAEDIFSTWNNL